MGDILGRVFAYFFGIIITFLVPVMIITTKLDSVSQSYINNAVVRFVDDARAVGKISPASYEKLCDDIDSAHMLCDIKITHSSAYTVPGDTINPDTGLYDYITYRYDYIKDEILDYMYPDVGDNREYLLKNGDYLKVEVINVTPTIGNRFASLFFNVTPKGSLYSSYGGYVGNNTL